MEPIHSSLFLLLCVHTLYNIVANNPNCYGHCEEAPFSCSTLSSNHLIEPLAFLELNLPYAIIHPVYLGSQQVAFSFSFLHNRSFWCVITHLFQSSKFLQILIVFHSKKERKKENILGKWQDVFEHWPPWWQAVMETTIPCHPPVFTN